MTQLVKAIKEAKIEAQRFIKKANAALQRLDEDDMSMYGSKETGAVKRASMDLSRALVEIRKGN